MVKKKRAAAAAAAAAAEEPTDAAASSKKARKSRVAGSAEFARLTEEAERQLDAMDFEAAAGLYTQALALRPDDTATLDMLAELCIGLGRIDDAHRYLTASTQSAPDEAHVKYMYLAQMAEGRDAQSLYERGLAILRAQHAECRDPETLADLTYDVCSACCSIAELYLTDLCFEEDAEAQCERWLAECKSTDPAFPEMLQLLGSLRISQHRAEEAREALRQAVDLVLGHKDDLLGERLPSVHSQAELAKLLLEVNDMAYGKRLLYHLLDADDENPYLWYLLGQCHTDEKRPTTAFKCFSRAKMYCGDDESLSDIRADSEASLARLKADHPDALTEVDPEGDLSDVGEEEEDEEEEGEGDSDDDEEEGQGTDEAPAPAKATSRR